MCAFSSIVLGRGVPGRFAIGFPQSEHYCVFSISFQVIGTMNIKFLMMTIIWHTEYNFIDWL